MDKLKRLTAENKGVLQLLIGITETIIFYIIYSEFYEHFYFQTLFPKHFFASDVVLPSIYTFYMLLLLKVSKACLFGSIRLLNVAAGQFITIFSINGMFYILLCLMANDFIILWPMLCVLGLDIIVVILTIFISTKLIKFLTPDINMLLVYGTDNAILLKNKLNALKNKFNVTGMISIEQGMDNVVKEIENYDAVVINDILGQDRNDLIKICYEKKIDIYMVPKITDILARGAKDINPVDTPLFLIEKSGLTLLQRIMKRSLDLAISSLGILFSSLIMIFIAIAIKIEDGGPIFYKQKRVTINGKEFDILKFRSMIPDAEKDGKSVPATDHDSRITKVGNIIRPFRLDELPQLFNIFLGDMSFVGPRPERVEHIQNYSKDIPEFRYRLNVKGGLTGYAQIFGKYNTNAYDKVRLDLIYIENYSFLLDLKLILLTIPIIFSKESTEGFEDSASKK